MWIGNTCGVVFLLATLIDGIDGGSYLITAPSTLYKGSIYDVTVDILDSIQGADVTINATLVDRYYDGTRRAYVTVNKTNVAGTFSPGQSGTLSMYIDRDIVCNNCNVKIRGQGGLQIDQTMYPSWSQQVVAVLVQTDKAIYKPGQIVRYRALAVYPNLMIYNGQFNVQISDPRGNVIQHITNLTDPDGIVEGSLAISDQPLFGDWSLRASLEGLPGYETQIFTVADYELPRFEVTVDLPPYGLLRETVLRGTVKAEYTFGQAVQGMVELHLGPNRGPDTCGDLPDSVQIAFEIDGEAEFAVPHDDFRRAIGYMGDGTEVKVTAFVKEAATGVRLNGSSVVKFHQNEHKIEFLDNTPNVFKPGLPYTAYFQVSRPDDMPPADSANRLVSVYTIAHYKATVADQHLYGISEFTGTYPLPGQNMTLPASGILPVDIDIPGNATKLTIKATYGDVSTSKVIENAYSPGNTFLQLALEGSDIQANSDATFRITGTEPLNEVIYRVLSRGVMVDSRIVQGNGTMTFTFNLHVTSMMAPTAHIIAYYAKNENEVVADSLAFSVNGIFNNEVAVNFNTTESEPGDDVTLAVTADAQSTVCVLAVDQSVLLLKSGNDITADKVSEEVSAFDRGEKPSDPEFALSYSSRSTRDVFTSVGLNILTDVNMNPPPEFYGNLRYRPGYESEFADGPDLLMGGARGVAFGGAPPGPPPGNNLFQKTASTPSQQPLAEVERIRQIFPEAWLWGRGFTGSNGAVSFQTKVPDTITSWVASAFAVSPNSGLGVAPTLAKLKVFRPFFVSLTFPNRVVRGERVVVQATVFNYLGATTDVRVTMLASDKYINLQVSPDGTETELAGDVIANIQVADNDQGVVYFPILTTSLGEATIEVRAQSTAAGDGVRRPIYVQPEGAAVSYNYPIFVNNAASSDVFTDRVEFPLPPSLVQGSNSTRVKVTGDLIGSSLTSMTSLLALPTGCGEQSMVKFAPNLYIYRYLDATEQLSQFTRTRIESYLDAGYQRQLTYQRYDGGFSAFGDRDEAGSTWLTSFVVRTLGEASDIIFIDQDMLRRGLNWLIERQSLDGSFKEFGNILDRSIQGPASRPSLTAHVLLTLIQSRNLFDPEELSACEAPPSGPNMPNRNQYVNPRTCRYVNATRLAQQYLENQVDRVEDQFSLSIIGLALSKARSPVALEVVVRLQQTAVTAGPGLKYWSANSTTTNPLLSPKGSVYLPTWRPPHVQARPLDILITSYVILTYTEMGQLQQAYPAVTWLVQQKNDKGGFVSSQDTIIALQALSAYATEVIRPDTNMEVKVTPDGSQSDHVIQLTQQNALTLQIQPLSSASSSLRVSGAGLALVEFDYYFHVNEELSTNSFDVSTVLLDDNIDRFNLMICTKWLWDRKTGMVVQEVSIPSGFEPDLQSMDDVAGMKKAERRGDIVEVYFDEITKTSLCYSVMMTRTGKVANTQKNYVRTYDYYSPVDQSTVFYQPVKLRDATVCDVCDGCCTVYETVQPL